MMGFKSKVNCKREKSVSNHSYLLDSDKTKRRVYDKSTDGEIGNFGIIDIVG